MAVTSVTSLMDVLREKNLLQPSQLQLVANDISSEYSDPRAAAEMLVRRKWLTPYQVEQLFHEMGGQNLVLGPYILLEPLGEGGMGQVFKARHQMLDRTVALKLIREERLSRDPEAVRRFQREAKAAAALSHPNIVMVYDAGAVGDTWFIAMEHIEGTDLSALVREQGPLAVEQACDFMRQAALGLQCAHENQMVHRDIKPSNLLAAGLVLNKPAPQRGLSAIGSKPAIPGARTLEQVRGRPARKPPSSHGPSAANPVIKILDMGLVRLTQTDDARSNSASLTQEGSIVGTPDYIAPEQARNAHRVDIRADLYSLGGTFYYLLTGLPPFPEGSAIEKLLMHQLDEPKHITLVRPDVPADVAAVVHKLLAKFPKDRHQTPAELADVLANLKAPAPAPARVQHKSVVVERTVRTESPQPVRPEPPRSAPPAPHTPMGLSRPAVDPRSEITPLITTDPGDTLHKAPPPRPAAPPPPAAPPAAWRQPPPPPAATTPNRTGNTPPPDQLVASSVYGWANSQTPAPSLLDPAGLGGDRLPAKHIANLKGHSGCLMTLAFSPNRDNLASGGTDGTVRVWDFTGKKPRERACLNKHLDSVNSLAFSADSRVMASGSGAVDGLVWLWDMNPEVPRPITVLQGHKSPVDALGFSHDSRMVVSGGDDMTVRVWEVMGTTVKAKATLKGHIRPIKCVAFSHDGQFVASASQDYTIRIWDIGRMWSKERAVLLHEGEVNWCAWAPDGKLLATACQDQLVRLWDMTAQPKPVVKATLKGHTGTVRRVLVTGDGQYVVAVGEGRQVLFWDVATGQQVREWLLPKALNPVFALTSDGRYLAHGTTEGQVNVYRVGDKRHSGAQTP